MESVKASTKVLIDGSLKRDWWSVLSLLVPLVIVGVAGMAMSYVTLIEVARVNGIPIPELFPVLVDMGTVACMIGAAQFRRFGMPGRMYATVTFFFLSSISVFANATHASRVVDVTSTSLWITIALATTPPVTMSAITHIVVKLIPDQKERAMFSPIRTHSEETVSVENKASTPQPISLIESPQANSKTPTETVWNVDAKIIQTFNEQQTA